MTFRIGCQIPHYYFTARHTRTISSSATLASTHALDRIAQIAEREWEYACYRNAGFTALASWKLSQANQLRSQAHLAGIDPPAIASRFNHNKAGPEAFAAFSPQEVEKAFECTMRDTLADGSSPYVKAELETKLEEYRHWNAMRQAHEKKVI